MSNVVMVPGQEITVYGDELVEGVFIRSTYDYSYPKDDRNEQYGEVTKLRSETVYPLDSFLSGTKPPYVQHHFVLVYEDGYEKPMTSGNLTPWYQKIEII